MRPLAILLLLASPAAAQAPSPYAGEQSRPIKALSPAETADLLAGRGMGLARAAELNGHPGPMHVLQLRDKLALTPAQAAAAQDSFNRMEAAARPLGAELVGRERALDDLFRTAAASPADVVAQTEAIGALQGRLRAVHLQAHIEMRALLTAGQVAAYDRLRGYTSGTAPAHGHGHAPG